MLPAPADHGVVFVRTDLPDRPRIPADADYVDTSGRRTSIRFEGADVHTIEHLLSACTTLKIDNAVVEIDGPELPGLDGSALPFVEGLRAAKPVDLDTPRKEFSLLTPVAVSSPGGEASTRLVRPRPS